MKYCYVFNFDLGEFPWRFPEKLDDKIMEEFSAKACTAKELEDVRMEKVKVLAFNLCHADLKKVEEWLSQITFSRVMTWYKDKIGSIDSLLESFKGKAPRGHWEAHDRNMYVGFLTVVIDKVVTVGDFDYEKWKKEEEVIAMLELKLKP